MAEYKETRGKKIKSYTYPSKTIWLDVSLKGLIVSLVLGIVFAYGDPKEAGVSWSIFGFFALIFSYGWMNIIFVHQPIEFYENGLSAFSLAGFPKRRQFLPWSKITRVEPFAYPHWHSDGRNSGVVLWHGRKSLAIREELENFEEFLIHLASNLKNFPEMKQWINPPTFGKQSGKILGTYLYNPRGRYYGLYGSLVFIALGFFFQFLYPILKSVEIDYFNLQSHQIKGFIILWGILLGLVFFMLYFCRLRYVMLKPLVLTEEGILGPLNDKNHKEPWYLKEPASIFFRWSDIHLMSKMKGSDYDAGTVNSQDGIRLMAGLKKIMIFKNISNFSEVETILKEKLPHLASSLDEKK